VITLAEFVSVIDAVAAAHVTVLSVLVDATLETPLEFAATPAGIVAITVPPVVIPVTATL
jgi:hypothetical protein